MRATDRIVVVGAGLAGARSCHELRLHGFTGELVLIGAEPHRPYDRPPLSKAVLLGEIDASPLDGDWYAGADLRTGVRATGLRPGELATWSDESGPGELAWDGLVLATGAVPRRLPGSTGEAHLLRTIDDAHRLRSALVGGARVVLVGAGWIGAEVATVAARRGCSVTVLEAAETPLALTLGTSVGGRTAPWYAEAGVRLRTGASVVAMDAGGVRLANGEHLPADVVVEAVGVRPDLAWLAGSGVEVDPVSGGVLVDVACRSSLPAVVAVGDCAARESPRTGRRVRTEHWDDALRSPTAAAATLLGEPTSYDPVPYVWSEQFGRYLQWVGWRDGSEPTLWRGDPTEPTGWAAAWLDDRGRLIGFLGVDRQRDVLQARRVIDAAGTPDPARLADPAVPVKAA